MTSNNYYAFTHGPSGGGGGGYNTDYTLTEPNAATGYNEHGLVAQNYPPPVRDPSGYEQNYAPHTTDYGYPARPQQPGTISYTQDPNQYSNDYANTMYQQYPTNPQTYTNSYDPVVTDYPQSNQYAQPPVGQHDNPAVYTSYQPQVQTSNGYMPQNMNQHQLYELQTPQNHHDQMNQHPHQMMYNQPPHQHHPQQLQPPNNQQQPLPPPQQQLIIKQESSSPAPPATTKKGKSKPRGSRNSQNAEGGGGGKKKSNKPLTAYARFFQEIQHQVREQHPEAQFGDISKHIAARWEQLTQDEKDTYKKRAHEERNQCFLQAALEKASSVAVKPEDAQGPPPPQIKQEDLINNSQGQRF